MAEVSLCATMTRPNEPYRVHDERVISCGRALNGVQIAILTSAGAVSVAPFVDGEILIKTPALMDEYLHRPELTERAMHEGYYKSGDLGFLDADGNLFVSGRKKNLIIRGGEKYVPGELETVATLENEVAQCAVVGVDDPKNAIQSIVLVAEIDKEVRARPGAVTSIAQRICDSARQRLGWGPELLVFTPRGRIPTTLNGKIQHVALKALLERNAFGADVHVRSADLRCS
jgi:acyl-CoA synthetase (AMP-forming)/AMP-acid ligase II